MKVALTFAVLTLCAWSAVASAGSVVAAKITAVRVDSGGFGMMYFDKALTTPAACVPAGASSRMSFDTNTPGGQGILSIVLSAKVSDRTVNVTGTNSCLHYTTAMESANFVNLN